MSVRRQWFNKFLKKLHDVQEQIYNLRDVELNGVTEAP